MSQISVSIEEYVQSISCSQQDQLAKRLREAEGLLKEGEPIMIVTGIDAKEAQKRLEKIGSNIIQNLKTWFRIGYLKSGMQYAAGTGITFPMQHHVFSDMHSHLVSQVDRDERMHLDEIVAPWQYIEGPLILSIQEVLGLVGLGILKDNPKNLIEVPIISKIYLGEENILNIVKGHEDFRNYLQEGLMMARISKKFFTE